MKISRRDINSLNLCKADLLRQRKAAIQCKREFISSHSKVETKY